MVLSTGDTSSTDNLFDEVNSTVTNCETGLSVSVRLIHINLFNATETLAKKSNLVESQEHHEPKPDNGNTLDSPSLREKRYALEQFNGKAALVLSANSYMEMLPEHADFIVGHAPIFAGAALAMRKTIYQDSKVQFVNVTMRA